MADALINKVQDGRARPTCQRRWHSLTGVVCHGLLALALAGSASGALANTTPWDDPAALPQNPLQAPPAADDSDIAGPGLRWSGFASLGASHTNSPESLHLARDTAQPRASGPTDWSNDTLAGLQANWQLSGQWEAVAQVVLKRQARAARAADLLEWAYLAWRPTPGLTLRLGRTTPDVFLLSDYRLVGFAFPWVRLDMNFYGWVPLHSIDGADARMVLSDDGEVTWSAYASAGQRSTVVGSSMTRELVHSRLLSASVTRQQGPWTLKFSVSRARMDMQPDAAAQQVRQGLIQVAGMGLGTVSGQAALFADEMDLSHRHIGYAGVGLQYEGADWQLHGEVSRTWIDAIAIGGTRAYASAARRWGDWQGFVLASLAKPHRAASPYPTDWVAQLTPLIGEAAAVQANAGATAAATAVNRARFDQRTVSVGARWHVTPTIALVGQMDWHHIAVDGAGSWDYDLAGPSRARVLSLALHAVF